MFKFARVCCLTYGFNKLRLQSLADKVIETSRRNQSYVRKRSFNDMNGKRGKQLLQMELEKI